MVWCLARFRQHSVVNHVQLGRWLSATHTQKCPVLVHVLHGWPRPHFTVTRNKKYLTNCGILINFEKDRRVVNDETVKDGIEEHGRCGTSSLRTRTDIMSHALGCQSSRAHSPSCHAESANNILPCSVLCSIVGRPTIGVCTAAKLMDDTLIIVALEPSTQPQNSIT